VQKEFLDNASEIKLTAGRDLKVTRRGMIARTIVPMHLMERSKNGKTTEMDLRYTGIWESAVRAGCSCTIISRRRWPEARVLTRRAGRFAHCARNVQDIALLLECGSGVSLQAMGKSLYAMALETVLGKEAANLTAGKFFHLRLERTATIWNVSWTGAAERRRFQRRRHA